MQWAVLLPPAGASQLGRCCALPPRLLTHDSLPIVSLAHVQAGLSAGRHKARVQAAHKQHACACTCTCMHMHMRQHARTAMLHVLIAVCRQLSLVLPVCRVLQQRRRSMKYFVSIWQFTSFCAELRKLQCKYVAGLMVHISCPWTVAPSHAYA